MSATTQRDLVFQLAKSDFERSLLLVDEITESWFATQALASVLRYCPEERMNTVCGNALSRAAMCSDAYSRGSVLAWVIRALAERGLTSKAVDVLQVAMQEVKQAFPSSSRAEALFLLYQAAFPLGVQVIEPLLHELITLQKVDPHWRVSRAVVNAVAIHSALVPDALEPLLRLIEDTKLTARFHRHIRLGASVPRAFFW